MFIIFMTFGTIAPRGQMWATMSLYGWVGLFLKYGIVQTTPCMFLCLSVYHVVVRRLVRRDDLDVVMIPMAIPTQEHLCWIGGVWCDQSKIHSTWGYEQSFTGVITSYKFIRALGAKNFTHWLARKEKEIKRRRKIEEKDMIQTKQQTDYKYYPMNQKPRVQGKYQNQ